MTQLDIEQSINALTTVLRRKVPEANLRVQHLPQAPQIRLALIEETYPQQALNQEQVEFLMETPPYWAFCWASGQVLARYLLANQNQVSGKTVMDFGSGSGVVAIAAKLAGAERVIALDNDPAALYACNVNAALNGVKVESTDKSPFARGDRKNATLLIADVFYDEENIPLLKGFLSDYAEVIVADSRVKPTALPGLSEVGRFSSSTVPDLGESADFNSVGIYRCV